MRRSILFATVSLLVAAPVGAQLSDAELSSRIRAGDADDAPVGALLSAASAAGSMRDYAAADAYLERAWQQTGSMINGLIGNALTLELASGGGAVGAQRAFRDIRSTFNLSPVAIAAWAGNFPELLTTGEFDDMILRLSPDADDPEYRCACDNVRAWVHRLAGREEEAREIWAGFVRTQIEAVDAAPNRDAEAQIRGQYARNLARAGLEAEAREHLRISMETEVSEEALPAVRRRWAQAYAELGDAEAAVEHLEALLASNSPVSVHSLEARVTWNGIRDHPAFQALLDRHR
ncbi:MAG: hypothetical protein R3304_04990 [Longimicrobiales bacterium]|nr:hypothetical protein [Longimicrobiales bacterium]